MSSTSTEKVCLVHAADEDDFVAKGAQMLSEHIRAAISSRVGCVARVFRAVRLTLAGCRVLLVACSLLASALLPDRLLLCFLSGLHLYLRQRYLTPLIGGGDLAVAHCACVRVAVALPWCAPR
jgi:hypothetical protein